MTRSEWLRYLVEREPYFFHRMELPDGLVTPGWSDPQIEKLPLYGLPDDMSGMRVLDVGCAEGFFSFEAERRGASEVIAIDSFPDSVRRFNICREAFDAKAQAFLTNVYDLSERAFGTFDLVMFFGVLYHLRHPLFAMEKVFNVCSGSVLVQSDNFEDERLGDNAFAEFHPFGIQSGTPENPMFDPTVFWVPNAACVRDMMSHVGFVNIEGGSTDRTGAIFRADAPAQSAGAPPDQMKAPWC